MHAPDATPIPADADGVIHQLRAFTLRGGPGQTVELSYGSAVVLLHRLAVDGDVIRASDELCFALQERRQALTTGGISG